LEEFAQEVWHGVTSRSTMFLIGIRLKNPSFSISED